MNKNLLAELARAGYSNKAMAEKIGISEVPFGNKIKGKTDWTLREMVAIQKILNEEIGTSYTLDYLFKRF